MNKKKTLVLGASTKEHRYSNIAIKRLLSAGNEVVAIGNRPGKVQGIPIETSRPVLEDIDRSTQKYWIQRRQHRSMPAFQENRKGIGVDWHLR